VTMGGLTCPARMSFRSRLAFARLGWGLPPPASAAPRPEAVLSLSLPLLRVRSALAHLSSPGSCLVGSVVSRWQGRRRQLRSAELSAAAGRRGGGEGGVSAAAAVVSADPVCPTAADRLRAPLPRSIGRGRGTEEERRGEGRGGEGSQGGCECACAVGERERASQERERPRVTPPVSARR
jgi:hypothetical protein